jgi:regulator of cell morphogenesis and NO signaling
MDKMEHEHLDEGNRWDRIAELTKNFQWDFGCKVSHVAFSLLKKYYEDLLIHIHLENNILFPKALDLKYKKVKINQS